MRFGLPISIGFDKAACSREPRASPRSDPRFLHAAKPCTTCPLETVAGFQHMDYPTSGLCDEHAPCVSCIPMGENPSHSRDLHLVDRYYLGSK